MTTHQLDLVDAPLDAGLAALERMRRRSRPTGPSTVCGDRLLVLLPPGSAADVPALLHWLGWGHLEGVLVPRQRAAEPWMEPAAGQPAGSALRAEELPCLLDTFADACARALLRPPSRPTPGAEPPCPTGPAGLPGLPEEDLPEPSVSRSPSRTPRGPCSARGRGR